MLTTCDGYLESTVEGRISVHRVRRRGGRGNRLTLDRPTFLFRILSPQVFRTLAQS